MAASTPETRGSTAFKTVVSRAISQADTGTTVQAVEIPAGSFVPPFGVSLYVAEAWAGGTPSLDVGDGDNDDGWIDTTDVTEGTLGFYAGDGGHAAYSTTGKVYTAKDTIDVVVSASATNGTAYVVVRYWDLSACDIAAST